MTSNIYRALGWLAAAVLATVLAGAAPASAFEGHAPIEPFGSFKQANSLAVDQSNGNLYVGDRGAEEVKVFGPGGSAPTGGAPSSFTGANSFSGSFREYLNGVAVDNACAQRGLSGSECTAFDPSNGDIYVSDGSTDSVDKYRLGGSGEYEYLCDFTNFGSSGDWCLPKGKEAGEGEGGLESGEGSTDVAVDSAGDVYALGRKQGGQQVIVEFSSSGKVLNVFPTESTELAVGPSGTIFAVGNTPTARAPQIVELKRSSLTGPVEGEPEVVPDTVGATGVAFDQANGELFVDLGSAGEALNGAHEVISRFGTGIIAHGGAIAVDEASGEGRGDVYVINEAEQKIDAFGPGVVETLPVVDEVSPSLSDVTRTSALLAGTINTGKANTSWQVEYVGASEYRPAAADPYANGGITAPVKLLGALGGTSVGPLALTGLLAGTTYDYRLVARNELGTTYGPNLTFTTAPATPPAVATGAAQEVTQTGVTLTGSVGTEELQTSYEFEVGTDTSYGGAKLFGNAGADGTEAVSASLQFLIPGTTYHYRLVASNEDGTTYGQDMTFTTPGVPAGIGQPAASALIASPVVQFPSVAGAITKAQGSGKTKKKARVKRRTGKKARGRARKKARKTASRHGSKHGGGGKGK